MTNSVIAIVKGGLGNQLFIYAASRALALRLDRSLYLDTIRGYTSDNFGRKYRLNQFDISAVDMPDSWRIAVSLRHPRHKIIRAYNKILPRNSRNYFAERHNLGASQLTALHPQRDRITLLGYWQNEAYFQDHADLIRAELRPPVPSAKAILERGKRFLAEERVFVHFRRINYNHVLGLDYYQKAIDEISKQLSAPKFAVFGDSIEEPIKELDFRGHPVEIVADNTEDELLDLWLMTQCRHGILANSSFSWWGAWLSQFNSGRLVYAPMRMGWPLRAASGWKLLPNTLITN